MAVIGSLAESTRARVAVALFVIIGAVLVWSSQADAAASLTVTPITFNVIGLDSNNVNAGPNAFPVGARVCNVGDGTATNLSAAFAWTTSNAYVALNGDASQDVDDIAPATCADVYFEVSVTRNAAAYDTTRRYTITVSGDDEAFASTPSPRELYVEHLVSQNRNAVASITGPSTVYVGDTVTFVLNGSTATQGYEQLESFLTMSPAVFRVQSVAVTYTSPSGGTNDKPWANACGFEFDPTDLDYRDCVGPETYVGGKAGGTMQVRYTAKVVGTGAATLDATIYDFSGSSYHYNGDYGDETLAVSALPALPPTTTTTSTSTTTSTTVASSTTTTNAPTTTSTTVAPTTSTTVAPTTTTTVAPTTTTTVAPTTTTTVAPTTTTTAAPTTTTSTSTTVAPTTTSTTSGLPISTTTTTPLDSAISFVINTGGLPNPVKQQGDGSATYSVVGGSLPPGLSLLSDGTFAGTATQVGAFEFDASVCENGICTVRHVRVEVLSAGQAIPATTPAPLARTGRNLLGLTGLGLLMLAIGALVRRASEAG